MGSERTITSRFSALRSQSLTELKGIGPSRLSTLENYGVKTIYDLLTVFPHRYEDRRQVAKLGQLRNDTLVTVQARVRPGTKQKRTGRVTVTQIPIADDTGQAWAVWFNQPYMAQNLRAPQDIILTGTAQWRYGSWQIAVKEYSPLAAGDAMGIIPFYRLPKGISQKLWRDLIQQALLLAEKRIMDHWPSEWLDTFKLPGLLDAISTLHFPKDWGELARGRTRLVFDELMLLRLSQAERRLHDIQAGF